MKGDGGIGDASEQCVVCSLLERMVTGQQFQNKASVLGKCYGVLVSLGGTCSRTLWIAEYIYSRGLDNMSECTYNLSTPFHVLYES